MLGVSCWVICLKWLMLLVFRKGLMFLVIDCVVC